MRITNKCRFTTVLYGARNGEIRGRELEMVKSLRHFTSLCSLISIEKIEKLSGPLVSNSTESKPSETIKISWYAQDPATRRLCKWKDFRKLFSDPAKAQLSKQWSKWADSVDVTANVATTSAESTGSSRNDGDLTSGISGFIGMLPIDWAAIPLMGLFQIHLFR
jgi:hypothetical protein